MSVVVVVVVEVVPTRYTYEVGVYSMLGRRDVIQYGGRGIQGSSERTEYTVHSPLSVTKYILYIIHCTLYIVQCIKSFIICVQCKVLNYPLYSMHIML